MPIDYKSLYRFGGYTVDQKRHLARLLAKAEAATTSSELSRKEVHKTLAGKFARDETERWQRYFEGVRAAIDGEDTAYDLDPHMHGWRNYQLERLVKSFGNTIISEKSYFPTNHFSPSQDLTTATGADWTEGIYDAALAGSGSTMTGGVENTAVTDSSAAVGSSGYERAEKKFSEGTDYDAADAHASVVVRIFVLKEASGSGALIYLDSDFDYGEVYIEYNNLTGAVLGGSYTDSANSTYTVTEADADSNYWEIVMRMAPTGGFTSANNIITTRIYPRGLVPTETGTIEVGNTELYFDTDIATIESADPVFNL